MTPGECQSKEDVRAQIDRIDWLLIRLFAERHGFVARMAEIKSDPSEAYDAARIERVVGRVRERAEKLDLDADQAEVIWRTLIDWNISFEKGIITARNTKDKE